jgi:hypothetical protein
MIPSPWIIVATIIALVVSFTTGYNSGFDNGKNETEAYYSLEKDKAHAEFQEKLDKYKKQVLEYEIKVQAIAKKNSAYTSKLEKELGELRNATTITPTCVPDDLRLRVNAVVGTINSYGLTFKASPFVMPDKLPSATDTK